MYHNTLRLICPTIYPKIRLKSVETLVKSGYSTKYEKSINEAELVGTIHKPLFTSPKFRSYLIKTEEPGNRFYYHMVGTDQQCHDTVGQRVHVAGRINSQNFWSEDGKIRQKVLLNASLFRPLANDMGHNDVNRVRIQAQISSEINNGSNQTSFQMTTAQLRGKTNFEAFTVERHRVLIRDPLMVQIARENLSRGDWVVIEGKISYTFWKNSLGKLRQSGYVLANSVQKEEMMS